MARTHRTRKASPSQDAGSATLDRAAALAAPDLRRLIAFQTVRTFFRLGFSACAALLVGRLVMGAEAAPLLVAGAVSLLFGSIAAGWSSDLSQARAESELSVEIRDGLKAHLQAAPAAMIQIPRAGELIVAVQRYPEAVAALVLGHRVQSRMMGIGPMLAAAAMVCVSWRAALTMLLLTPVMIVFFALVGDAIRRRAETQEKAFGCLAGQFADRIRTLPTIVANHALGIEEAKLEQRLRHYAASTVGVLRIAFANAGLIDFFASLSIAMLALFLGLGHLKLAMIPGFSNLELWQSLFILMIAPDYFAPFRRFAEQYHVKAEGLAAAAALDRILGLQAPPIAHGLRALPELTLQGLPRRGLVAIAGPSGAGKSTLLRRLAGIGEPGSEPDRRVTWIATDAYVPDGTLAEAIAWTVEDVPAAALQDAAHRVAFVEDALTPDGLRTAIAHGGSNLSGGQRMRIALARAFVREGIVIADEPTAKLDPETAAAIRRGLCELAATRLVVVASHDPALLGLADCRIDLGSDRLRELAA